MLLSIFLHFELIFIDLLIDLFFFFSSIDYGQYRKNRFFKIITEIIKCIENKKKKQT